MSDESVLSYFDLQAYIGTTKHMGGFETTYLRSADFRAYMKGRRHLPKSLFEYWGYALFVGRKREKRSSG